MIAVSVEESFCSSYSSLSCGWWALSTSSSSLQSLSLSSLPLLTLLWLCHLYHIHDHHDYHRSHHTIVIASSLSLGLSKVAVIPSWILPDPWSNADSDRNSNAVTLIDIEWIKSAKWSVIDAWKLIIDPPGGKVDTFQEAAQVKWGGMEFIHVFFTYFFTHFKRQCMSNGEAVEFLQQTHRCWLWRVWNEGTWDLNFLQNLVTLWISCNSVLFLQLRKNMSFPVSSPLHGLSGLIALSDFIKPAEFAENRDLVGTFSPTLN